MTNHGACSTACKGGNQSEVKGGGKAGKGAKGGGKVKGKKGKKNR